MSRLAALLSTPMIGPLLRSSYRLRILANLDGIFTRKCTICGYEGRFKAYGDPPRWDARCTNCKSLERHRLLALALRHKPELISGDVVHFAPEKSITRLIQPMAGSYRTADLYRSDCDLLLNLEAIELADGSVDVFMVSHLLEHVDDRKALSELFRCLRPNGCAIIMVPIAEGWSHSYENADAASGSDQDRLAHFGQIDHIRYYGTDLRVRIEASGFELSEFTATGEECVTFGLVRGEKVFIAKRPPDTTQVKDMGDASS